MFVITVGDLHYFIFGPTAPWIVFQDWSGNLIVLNIPNLVVKGRLHFCQFKTGTIIGGIAQKAAIEFRFLFIREIQGRLGKGELPVQYALPNTIQFRTGLVQLGLGNLGGNYNMPNIQLASPDLFHIDDMISKNSFKGIGYFPFPEAKSYILKFLYKSGLTRHTYKPALGFRSGILRIQNGLYIKTGTIFLYI